MRRIDAKMMKCLMNLSVLDANRRGLRICIAKSGTWLNNAAFFDLDSFWTEKKEGKIYKDIK